MGPETGSIGVGGDQADQVELHRRQLGEALNAIRGADSRRLLREVADLSMRGAALPLNEELTARYGKRTGTAFAGIVAGPNKVMRRVARRDLVTWDADARGYRMDPADARDHPPALAGRLGRDSLIRPTGRRVGTRRVFAVAPCDRLLLEQIVRKDLSFEKTEGHCDHRNNQEGRFRSRIRLHQRG